MAMIPFPKFAESMLFVKTKEQDLVQLKLWDSQIAVWRVIKDKIDRKEPVRVSVLKARQLGISTFCQALLFWKITTHPYTDALSVAHDAETTARIFDMSRTFYDHMPIRPMRRYSTKKELVLENPSDTDRPFNPGLRSKLEIRTAGTASAGRGGTRQALHGSEIPLWRRTDILKSALFPSVPSKPGTIIILEGTAHGAGDYWHEHWSDCRRGASGFTPVFLPFNVMRDYQITDQRTLKRYLSTPLTREEKAIMRRGGTMIVGDETTVLPLTERHMAWRRMKIEELGSERLFMQEFPLSDVEAWLVAGNPCFDEDLLNAMFANTEKPEIGYMTPDCVFQKDPRGNVSVWKRPEDDANYYVGVDSSSGTGPDKSAIQVVKCSPSGFEQVAKWHGYIDPIILAHEAEKLARYYNQATVSIEVNYHGIATQMELRNTYSNMFRWRMFDRYVDRPGEKIGWETNIRTKPLIISFMAHCIREGTIKIYDRETINEALHFVEDEDMPGTGEAASGFTDDLIMSLMICIYSASLDGTGTIASSSMVKQVTGADLEAARRDEFSEEPKVENDPTAGMDPREIYLGAWRKLRQGREDEVPDWRVI